MRSTSPASESKSSTIADGKSSSSMSFEDALTATGFGIFNYILIINAGVILTGILLETLIISFVLPVAQCDLNLTTNDKGILSGAAFLGLIVSTHLWGFLADTFGRRTIMYRTLFISFACTFASSMATNFWFLLVFRFLSGFFVSGAGAAVYPYLSEFHNMENRTRAIVGSSIVFGVGSLSLAGLAWLVLYFEYEFIIPIIGIIFKPWRLLIIAGGVPSFVSGFATLWYPESPKFLLHDKNEKETIGVIKQMFRWNGGSKTGTLVITSLVDDLVSTKSHSGYNIKSPFALLFIMWTQTALLFSSNYIRPTLIAMMMQFGVVIISNGFYMWLPDILNRYAEYQHQFPNTEGTICEILNATGFGLSKVVDTNSTIIIECFHRLNTSTFQLSLLLDVYYAIGFIVLGVLVRFLGKLPLIIIVTTITGACSLALPFITVPSISIHLLLIILACGLVLPLITAATVELYPTELRATGVCIAMLAGRIGSIAGSNLSGILLRSSSQITFILAGINLILCGIIGFFIPHIYKIVDKKIVFA